MRSVGPNRVGFDCIRHLRHQIITFGQKLNTGVADPDEQMTAAGPHNGETRASGELAAIDNRQWIR